MSEGSEIPLSFNLDGSESTRNGDAVATHKQNHNADGPFRTKFLSTRLTRRLFTTKTFTSLDSDLTHSQYKRTLTALDLVALGVGAVIGAGIFVLTGKAAKENAGPAIVVSFVVAGVVAALAALCYAEMASMIPVSGSAYTFTYASMGELFAWIIGWDLLLEYLVGAATVASGWSGYLSDFVADITHNNYALDPRWINAPVVWYEAGDRNFFNETVTASGFARNIVVCGVAGDGASVGCAPYFNVPAFVIVLAITALLVIGIRESTTVNTFFVLVKVTIVLMFIFAGIKFIDPQNYHPFIPPAESHGRYGVSGIFQAAVVVFFAYIGFDAVSTTAQEAVNPQRDLPIGIIGSLLICTALYIATSAVLTGMVNYKDIHVSSPVSSAIRTVGGPGMRWLSIIIEIGALFGLTSVMLTSLLAQPRVLQAMARDGLLPPVFGKIHPRFKTPYISTLTVGLICAILAALFPIDILGNITSIGSLFAFLLVSLSVIVTRIRNPDRPRRFKIPGGFWVGGIAVPILAAACSVGLMSRSAGPALIRLAVWAGVGLVVYFCYGFRR
ncbi:hypothetical protein HK104_001710 [Borealophlyctis nickersoniae]|nr:hypothetical protein HK104_001710 [Borealophlyctis nickersoniae]